MMLQLPRSGSSQQKGGCRNYTTACFSVSFHSRRQKATGVSPPSPPKKRSRRQDNFSPCRDFAVSLLLLLLHPSKSPSSSSSSSNQTFPRGAARKKGATFARFYNYFLSPFSGQTFYFRVLQWLQTKNNWRFFAPQSWENTDGRRVERGP